MSRGFDSEALLAARAPELHRFAALLTGDATAGAELRDRALAEVWRHRRGLDPDRVDDALHAAAVQRWLRWRPAPPVSCEPLDPPVDDDGAPAPADDPIRQALADLPPRQRALLVLCTYDGLAPREAAGPVGLPPRRAARETRAALFAVAAATGQPVEGTPHAVRDVLLRAAERVATDTGASLGDLRRHAAAADRRARRGTLVAAATVAVLLAVGVRAALPTSGRAGPRPAPSAAPSAAESAAPSGPPVAVAGGLLAWPTRGSLAGDAAFRDSALGLWQRTGAVARPHPLYLGVINRGRVAVLEGLASGGVPYVAILAEHGPPGAPTLTLDFVNRLGDPALPLLVIPYAGMEPPGLSVPGGSELLQLLVAPGVTRVVRRGPEGVFYEVPVRTGLSATWWSPPSGDRSRGIVQAYTADGLLFDGYLPGNDVTAEPVDSTRMAPPWPLLGDAVDDRRVRDDAVLFAARNAWSEVHVSVVWAGRLPDGSLARLELADSTNPAVVEAGLVVAREGADALGPVRIQHTYGPGSDVVWAGPAGPDRPFVVAVARPGVARMTYGVRGGELGSADGRVLIATSCGSCPSRLRGYNASGRPLFSVAAPS